MTSKRRLFTRSIATLVMLGFCQFIVIPRMHLSLKWNLSLSGLYHTRSNSFQRDKLYKNVTTDDVPQVYGTCALCHGLFLNDTKSQEEAMYYQFANRQNWLPDTFYIQAAKNCDEFITSRQYITHHITEEERTFPIAFSLLVYKDVEQIERLLRAIYRPQNYYCIHVDKNSGQDVQEAILAIANCFPNVMVPISAVEVEWGRFSVLHAELICLKELEKHEGWRYFINLTGQEFPLKINADLVKILKVYNGAADVPFISGQNNRTRWIYQGLTWTASTHSPPPEGVTIAKGGTHVVLPRGFVQYVLHNQTARELLDWVRDTKIPDETYFNSLNASPQLYIPGSYTGKPTLAGRSFARYKRWFHCEKNGLKVHDVCIVSIFMLPKLHRSGFMFVNKLHLRYHPLAMACLEQLHYNRTRDQIQGVHVFKTHIYQTAPFVRHYRRSHPSRSAG